jgi:hypothetical protein
MFKNLDIYSHVTKSRIYLMIQSLKRAVPRDFFHESVSPKTLNIQLGPLGIFSKICDQKSFNYFVRIPLGSRAFKLPLWCNLHRVNSLVLF